MSLAPVAPTYEEFLRALFSARRLGVRLDLERVREVLARLGDPQKHIGAVVHVGGTNGKGSTAAFVEAALRAAGLRTGLYTSPHLVRFTERFRVGGREVVPEALVRRWQAARAAGLDELTFFEQATVLAFLTFAEERTEVAVLEVGLGGRLDATNVVDAEVAVVTGVALDHEEILGRDVETIAREKAGIFKPGRWAVVGPSGAPQGRFALVEGARARGVAGLVEVGRDAEAALPSGLRLGLAGEFQRANAATALAALDALERATAGRVRIPAAARRAGLEEARWPGRLERIGEDPPVWLDAAHNPDGARTLAAELVRLGRPDGQRVLVVGVSADKDVPSVLGPLVAQADLVIAAGFPSARALAPEEIARIAAGQPGPPGRRVVVEPLLDDALARARAEASPCGRVVVAGSIFLVGAARARLLSEPEDPVLAQDPAAGGRNLRGPAPEA